MVPLHGIAIYFFSGISFMKHYTSLALTAAMITGLLLGTTACADNNRQDTKEVAEELNDHKFDDNNRENDAQFLVNAAEMSREEISLGELALKKGRTKHVRSLGAMMVTEHTAALAAVTALAKSKNVSLPTAQTDSGRDAFRKLTDIKAKSFDKEYADMMVNGHKSAITLFEKASNDSKDAEINAWATSSLPSLRTHLEHSLECQKLCEKM